jgi:ABC-type uncharacterized transport system involved in gliding motility auxiliary subunit
MRGVLGLLGLAGATILAFGVVPFALTGVFDLWVAVHVTGGAILVAIAVALDFARLRRTLVSRSARERWRAVVGTVLFVGVLVVVNVIASRHPLRLDVTEHRVHTLSEKSRSVARSLEEPVELIAFVAEGAPGRIELARLLERFASESARVTWRLADPVREPELATTLGVRDEGVLVARRGEVTARTTGDPGFGWTEGALANLLLKAGRPGPRTIYLLTGHGEGRPDDAGSPVGLGLFAGTLADQGYEVRPLLLSAEPRVPDNAALLAIAGPAKPLTDHEVEQVAAWAERGGRTLLLVDPATDTGIEELLAAYRVAVADDMVVDPGRTPFGGPRPGLALIVDDFPPHPITAGFRERIALDRARSVNLLAVGRVPGAAVEASILARAGESAWSEVDYEGMISSGRISRSPETATGPIPVAVAARARRTGDGAESTREARWVVVGDSQLARNAGIGAYFNREFLLNAVEWLVGQEQLIGEEPRGLRPSRLDMSRADFRNLFRLSVLLLPEVLVILGLAVWWWRRSL